MTARAARLFSMILTCAGLIPAQTYLGEAPTLMRPLAEAPGIRPATFGWASIEWMHHRLQPDGHHYFAMSGRTIRSSPSRLAAWRRHPTTLAWTRTSDFDAITQDGDQQVSVSHDLLTSVIFRNNVGMLISTRASTGAAWGPPRPIIGLPASAYSPSLGLRPATGLRSAGTETILFGCRLQPLAITLSAFDPATGTASNTVEIYPSVQSGNTLGSVTGMEDAYGVSRKLIYNEKQTAGFGQRYWSLAGLEGTSPAIPMFDSPTNKIIANLCQVSGGTFYGPLLSVIPTTPFPQDTVVQADLLGAFNSSEVNGQLDITMFAPAAGAGIALMLAGVRGTARLPIPGIGNFALAPVPLLVFPFQNYDEYVTWRTTFGQEVTGEAEIQPLLVDQSGNPLLGGTATVNL